MSDGSPGAGWWQASDGNWYPPDQHPGAAAGARATPQASIEQVVAQTVERLNPYGLIILGVWVVFLFLLFAIGYST